MITVKLREARQYNAQQLEKLTRVFAIMEQVLNAPAFREAVLNFETDGQKGFSFRKNLFRHFETYTNEEVYALLMQAQEEPGDVASGTIDLYLVLEPGADGQNLGYGLPGNREIHTYADYFNNATEASLANHFTHEWCHKIGFEHAQYRWMDRNRDCCSVPYAIGNLIEELYVAAH